MTFVRKPTPEWAAEGRRMRAEGKSWGQIARRLCLNMCTIRYWCCDNYRAAKLSRGFKKRPLLTPEERRQRALDSRRRTKAKCKAKTGLSYDKWQRLRAYCRELAAQQGRPVEELYREFGVER